MKKSRRPKTRSRLVNRTLLRAWPLPQPDATSDKDERGPALVIAGSEEIPGAAFLSGSGILRVGAGKLQIGTSAAVAIPLALVLPEALVFSMSTQRDVLRRLTPDLGIKLRAASSILIGPGLKEGPTLATFVRAVAAQLSKDKSLILDAAALGALKKARNAFEDLRHRLIITPHAGEMASLVDKSKAQVESDTVNIARDFAQASGAVTVLKGSQTVIADPSGEVFLHDAGDVGLATGGSGDVLAGMIAGLAARGADPVQAALWGVYLHAKAGDSLRKKLGRLGYLAHELLREIPALLDT